MPTTSAFDSPPYTAQMEASVCAGVPPVPSTAGSSPLGTSFFGDFEPIYNDYFYTTESDKLASVDQWKDYLHSEDAAFADVPTTAADALAEDLSWLEEEIDQNLINEFMADPYFCVEPQPQQTFQPEPQQQVEYIYYEQPQSSSSSASASPTSNYVSIAPRPASQSQSPQPASSTVSPAPSAFNIPPVPTDRKRRKPMTFSSAEEEYAVKRQLNNIASARSRQKKKDEVERRKTELLQLESRNRELKGQFEEYERQIETLKTILYSKIQK
uniref:BZIP domain-containing protein n=1 Tax=Panagrellus redivivus TaxID=6233 RepID=A0A7E4UVH6_PANRE